ncbi:IclR family transcriptional regulator [Orrella sp. JC864]|uniref:IclR family transcriptional regulator n=1 Tax=Orrella sp. JC864 TaxID=3120298 RepID=UPI003009E225
MPLSSRVARRPKTGAGADLSQPARRKRAPAEGLPDAAADSPDFITALARGLQVLRCFQPGVAALGNQDLARLTGLPKPTLSRITYTLTSLGYLRYHADSGKYSPGYGVLALGYGLLANLEVRQLARPGMEQLAQETGAAVALGTFDVDAMLYVEAVHGSSALYLRLPVGYRVSLDSAMGRAYLAGLAQPRREALLERLGTRAPSPETVARACAEQRESGCCFAIGDWQAGINAVAVPFTPVTGEGRFVMSVGGPASLLPPDALRERIAPLLRETAGRLGSIHPSNEL